MFISVSFGVTVSPGLLLLRLGNGHLPGVRPRRRVTQARRGPRVGWFSWTALRELEVQANGYDPRSLFLASLPDRRVLDTAGVQGHRHEAGPGPGARVPSHPVQTPRRFVERVAGLVLLDRLVVDGVLVLALQDVAERRAGVAVRRILLAGPEGYFVHRRAGSLPAQLLDDVPLGQLGHLHGLVVVMVGRKRNGHSHTDASRER